MIIKIIKFCLNNVKMQNFSQINKSTKRKKQLGIQDSIQFKIQPPVNERRARQLIPQSSFLDQSEKSNSSVLKNTARSSYSDKLQQQYISYKLKPSCKKENSLKEDKEYKINFNKKSNVQFQNKFIQKQLQIIESETNSLSKSPQFLCKKASPINSQKESFAEQFKENFQFQNTNRQSFKFKNKQSHYNNPKMKNIRYDEFVQLKQKRSSLEKDDLKFLLDQNFQDYEVYTPFKELKQQFQRQQRILMESATQKVNRFDSFNQSQYKDNFFEFDQNNKLTFDNFESFKKKSIVQKNQKEQSIKNKLANQIENRDINTQFFFLTDPTLQQSSKQKLHDPKNKQILRTPRQKQVREFCFNISQIKIKDEKEQSPYCNPNLFSNSNEYLMFFDSKNLQKQVTSQNSKRMHVRQLVEQFIQQLEHVDDKSLNQKVVSNLQNVLQEIVFKEPKAKCDPILIEEPVFTPRQYNNQNQIKGLYDDSKFKKWTKPKKDINLVSCQRKIFNEINEQKSERYDKFFQIKQQNLAPNSMIPSKYSYEKVKNKSPIAENNEIQKKENKKPVIYKPNFDLNINKSPLHSYNNRKKEQLSPPKNLMFTKHRQGDSSQIKINPKGSIYFNNKKSSSRQHLKTENSRKTWRVY